MVVFPNAKINLGLNIINKLPSGYHSIQSCFYPIPLTDALEVLESNTVSFTSSGIKIPGKAKQNLCLEAYKLVKQQFDIPPIAIHLHKNIPIGAGLGGGSADGAFMIKLLQEKFNLGMSDNTLEKLAGTLGSDCPFFIRNKPLFVEGTGNIFSEINTSLKGKFLVLVLPLIHVSTAQAYANISPQTPKYDLKANVENLKLAQFKDLVKNDFEESVFLQFPTLAVIKEKLLNAGALYASMSGSGSSVFGLFEKPPVIDFEHPNKVFKI